jgi:hypothetical protein
MKTLKQTTLVVALMFGTLFSYAKSEVDAAPMAFSYDLTIKEPGGGNFLAIKDNSGHTIYSETVNTKENFKTSYDLSKLEDGVYTLELNKDFEIKTKQFVVVAEEVTFLESTERSVYKPVFRMENSRMLISQLALDKESTLEIKIYYENNLIHQEEVSGNAILNRVYNLKENTPGHYKVIMKANGRTYKRNFKI